MEEEKPQFDAHMGGKVNLPFDVGILKFVEPRIEEITALTQAINEPTGTGLVFQRLPRHMRRRVMGHTSKRMPRSKREAHIKQLQKSGFPPKPKRPSRRHRRRPKNLLSEYNRRQKTFVWLETHIWHAKRFHMVEKWGYKLAFHPNDKSIRACYRASANHCLLHDVSYLVCIELTGQESVLLDGLSHLCSPACGRTFAAKSLLLGQFEGHVTLYHADKYPYAAIGHVSFLWKPPTNEKSRTIWIWNHPSFYQEVVTEIQSVFTLTEVKSETVIDSKSESVVIGGGVEAEKLAARIPPPVYKNQNGVVMTVLKDALARFRLTGPLSQAVLQETLAFPPESRAAEKKVENVPMDIDEIFSSVLQPSQEVTEREEGWSGSYYITSESREDRRAQTELWQQCGGVGSPAQFPPHCVLGLTVLDPRMNLPDKRTKAVPASVAAPFLASLAPHLSRSPLWSRKVRDQVTSEKLPDFSLNAERSLNLVPGMCEQEPAGTRLPLLLVQRPGCRDSDVKRLGLGSGWDVVLPAGWSMPLWRSLVLRGARVGGLRELEALGTETLTPLPPLSAPDSEAGRTEQARKTQDSLDLHFKKPPAKRPNFMKLGIPSPFGSPWSQLVREWSSKNSDEYYVLRDRSKLEALRLSLKTGTEISSQDPQSLVMVAVVLEKGGALDPWALICLPETNEDLSDPPKEPNHVDVNEKERKESREKHHATLKKLRRKRVKSKKKGEEVSAEDAEMLAKAQEEKMRQLWLPSPKELKNSNERQLAGFVTQGKFSYSEGKSAGLGYVTEPALRSLLLTRSWNSNMNVLVRNTTTLQYRVAKFIIL